MEHIDDNVKSRHFSARLGAAAAALVCLGLLVTAPPASAAYEQVGCFAGSQPGPSDSCKPVKEEEFSEEVQLGGVGGMAVNINGAGGVPAGTLYAASWNGELRVTMFEPEAGGGMRFVEAWQSTADVGAYERCGPSGELPDGELIHPSCPTMVQKGAGSVDVDVDQATGNVYVLNGEQNAAGKKVIVEYSADGGEEITRFGEKAPNDKTVAETPEMLHATEFPGSIAVNSAGDVYAYDRVSAGSARLMVFKPQSPGDYAHYAYVGDVLSLAGHLPTAPVTDAAGNIYVGGGAYGKDIKEYAPEAPVAYPAPAPGKPLCSFEFAKAGIVGTAVNPASGEVFFYSYKLPKRVRRLGSCNPKTGEFTELTPEPEAIAGTPERGDLSAMAFDPTRQLEAGRASGVLYAGTEGPMPGSGLGQGEKGQSSLGYIFTHAKEVAPKVEAQSVTHVGSISAVLQATINTNSFETHYVFQYESAAEYEANLPGDRFAGAKDAPPGGASMLGAQGGQSVAAALSDLQPDTEYRYRALATSECAKGKSCPDEGAVQSFTTFSVEAPGLPDHRAYELVSPVKKNGGQVLPLEPGIDSCPEIECKPGTINTNNYPKQIAPDGDTVVYAGSPLFEGQGAVIESEYIAHRDPQSGWQSANLAPSLLGIGAGAGYKAFDTRLTQGLLSQLSESPILSPSGPIGYPSLYSQPTGAPTSLTPLLSEQQLIESPHQRSAKEFKLGYAGASADLSRVFFEANDSLTSATPVAPAALDGGAAKYNLYEWERATGQLRLVNVLPGNAATLPGPSGNIKAVSADGRRVFFSDEAGHLYVREDAEVTSEISGPGHFLATSTDGSKVLLSDGHIYDLETKASTDLTKGKGGFLGLSGQSDDLSHVYFVDTEVLSGEEANSEGAKAQAGKANLYAWHEGGFTFVATLVATDEGQVLINDWAPSPSRRTAQASPQGRLLAFQSQAQLTSYDNTGPCESNHANGLVAGPCPEIFLYDSATATLSCVSCNRSGERPLGRTLLPRATGSTPRYLTDSGRLYFDSQDSLLPADTNAGAVPGRAVEDVYQFEPQGLGTCERQSGCLSLISAGTGTFDSNFFAADASGKNVFLTTRDQLVLKDKDELIDLYDAREGGGIASETEAELVPCQGEACQPPAVPPNDSTPGSSSFEGAGNVDEKKVAKKNKHKKKQKHAKKHKSHKRSHGRANRNHGGAK